MKRRPWLFSGPIAGALLGVLTGCHEGQSPGLEPGEELPGGTVTHSLFLGKLAFSQPIPGLSPEQEQAFFTGNALFNQAWVQAPASTTARDGLGPLFNARSCSACHLRDGRSGLEVGAQGDVDGVLFRLSVAGQGGTASPDPTYGSQFQPLAIQGVPAEGRQTVVFSELNRSLPDGTPFTLRQPAFSLTDLQYGPLHAQVAIGARTAPAMVGLGLLEAIPQAALEALADPHDLDGDGISGRVHRVTDPTTGALGVGRFGWKAEQVSVLTQSAGALIGDLGVTSPIHPDTSCTTAQPECEQAISGGEPEITAELLGKLTSYASLLAVPVRRHPDAPEVLQGKALFNDIGCASCHTPSHRTGNHPQFSQLSQQLIWPYTDLLLHDMGPELADGVRAADASGSEWRTPPLWGLGLYAVVNGHEDLLHDGRARGVEEAILWHGGEAQAARERFRALDANERAALAAFVRSL